MRLHVFSIIAHIFTLFNLFYLCREKPQQETAWTDSLVSLFCVCICNFIVHEHSHALIFSFKKVYYLTFHRISSVSWKAFPRCTNMFRRFWIHPLVDYNPDHGRFSQNCVRFHEADDLSRPTFPTYTIPMSAQLRHMATDKMGVALTRVSLFKDSHLSS